MSATRSERSGCVECGSAIGADGYCTHCGLRARHHGEREVLRPATWVAGVCDRGLRKATNEDALALAASENPDRWAALVVLDGVSRADDSAAAARAGAAAALDALASGHTARTPPRSALRTATAAAQRAVSDHGDPRSASPASSTLVAVVVADGRLHHAGVGDSRAYWLPDTGRPRQLTTDDAVGPALTKWLGVDSEDAEPRLGEHTPATPGWVVVCSDGFWHYAAEPEALQEHFATAASASTGDPGDLVTRLLALAHEGGGHDNITVAVARVGGIGDNGASDAEAGETNDG